MPAYREGPRIYDNLRRLISELDQVSSDYEVVVVSDGNRDETATGHGTQKPVELMRRPILNHTEAGDAVYDAFLGSGSTLIAAEQTERVCYGLEIDSRYVDVIVSRWQQFSGKQATLAGTNDSFDRVREMRQRQPE